MTTHRCSHPRCNMQVPNSKFACRAHWFVLPKLVRDLIWDTSGLPLTHPDRREAIKVALQNWRMLG